MTKKLCLCLSPLPDIHPQSFKGATCLGDSVVDLSINVGIAGACTTQVCEGLYHLKGLAVHWYLWLMALVSRSWLKHYFGLFGADGKTKVVAGWGKAVYTRFNLLLGADIYGAVISKQKVSENSLPHLYDSLQRPGVEQLPLVLYLMPMPSSESLKVSDNMAKSIMLNSVGTRTQPNNLQQQQQLYNFIFLH